MVMGATVANLARHHEYPFHAIEAVDWPVLILFFVLAGASLDLAALLSVGTLGGAYVVLRVLGKVVGGWLGGLVGGSPPETRRRVGLALLPQAGVALGMALVAAAKLPEYRQAILSVAIGSTVFFELFGPLVTRYVLRGHASPS
ncbi:MAG: cation:proton antiporter, partial [Pseudomonadota bacterium]